MNADCLVWWWKILVWGNWYFKLTELLLDNWIADCFLSHAWFELSVSFCYRKFLLTAVGMFRLINWIVHFGTYGSHSFLSWWKIIALSSWEIYVLQLFLHCLFSLVMENSCLRKFEFLAYFTVFDQLDCRFFLARMVCTVCSLSWWFFFACASWNFDNVQIFLINWIILLGTDCFHCLFSLVMECSCSRQLEFWTCPTICGQLDCRLFR